MYTLPQHVPIGLRRLLNSLAFAAVAIVTGAGSFIASFFTPAGDAARLDLMVALRYEFGTIMTGLFQHPPYGSLVEHQDLRWPLSLVIQTDCNRALKVRMNRR